MQNSYCGDRNFDSVNRSLDVHIRTTMSTSVRAVPSHPLATDSFSSTVRLKPMTYIRIASIVVAWRAALASWAKGGGDVVPATSKFGAETLWWRFGA